MKSLFSTSLQVLAIWSVVLSLPLRLDAQTNVELSLQAAIQIALEENPRILAAQRKVDAARGRSWRVWWLSDPSFVAEYEGIPSGKGIGAFGERRLSLTQSIDFPTNIFFKKKLASNDVSFSEMRFTLTKLELTAGVKKAFYGFIAKRDNLTLAQENLQLAREFMQKAKTRYEVGEAPNLEYIRARVGSAQAENEVTQAQSELIAAQAALNVLLARPAEAPVYAPDTLSYRSFDNSLYQLKKRAFEIHPRLQAIGYQVAMAQQTRNLAWGSFLPEIEATAFLQSIDGNPNFYGIEIGLSLPLWFPFRQRGNIEEASATLSAVRWDQENEKHLIDAEIESRYAAVKSAWQQVNLYTEELLAGAEEVYRIALRSYEEGESTYLELLEAQRILIEVRAGYIDALADYNIALADLEQAVGEELK